MNGTQRALGVGLKKYRLKRKLSLEQLADKTQIPVSRLEIMEAGFGNPDLRTICKLTEVLRWRFTVTPKQKH